MIANEPERVPASARNADAWFTPGRFALLLAGLIVLKFPGVVLGLETFFYRDFGLFTYPLAYHHRELFWQGQLPLWNPLNNCGLPFLAQWNTITLYPLSLIYLLFPVSWSLGMFCLSHLFLAGMGMYFLARRWTGNSLAASIAGVVFAFNGLIWHSLMWTNDVAALGWMPWVVLCVERAWREGGRRIVIAALVGGIQMLAGAPEIILLTWVFIGVLWVAQLFSRDTVKSKITLRVIGVGIAVAGLAAIQLLPFLDLLRHSHRDTEFAGKSGWAMPLSGPANLLVPLYHCFEAGQGVFVQYDQYWVASYYMGAGVIALAIAGVWRTRNRRVWLLLGIAVLSVLMALGNAGYVYAGIKTVLPQLGFLRYPIKFVVLAVLAIPLLAAYGVSWFQAAVDPARTKILRGITLVLIGLVGVIVFFAWEYPMVKDNWAVTWHCALGRIVFLILIPATFLLLRRIMEFKLQILLRVMLLLLFWLDIHTHAPNLSPTVQRHVYEPGIIRDDMKLPARPGIAEPRFMESLSAMNEVHFISLPQPANDYMCRRLALFDDCNLLDDLPKVDGFYSLYLRDAYEIAAILYQYDSQGVDLKGLKDFLGIGHVNVPGAVGPKALEWVSRDSYLPRVTAGQNPVFASVTNTLIGLTQTNFNPRETVFLPLEASPMVKARKTTAQVVSQRIENQRIIAKVTASAPAMVTVAQAFYHPWHAYVDGQRVKLWEADYGFQALEVPAGSHEVKLVYEDPAFRSGAAISCATLFLLGAVWLRQRKIH